MNRCRILVFSLVVPAVFFSVLSVAVPAPLMVEKNLFAQDRKPPPVELVAAAPQSNKPGLSAKAVQLDGVFIHGETRKALVRFKGQIPGSDKVKGQNPFFSVHEGEKIGDFQVIKIEPRSISLEKDGQVSVVGLFAEGKVVPPAPPVPAFPTVAPPPGVQPPGFPGAARAGGERVPRPQQPGVPSQPGGGNLPPGAVDPNVATQSPQDQQTIAGQEQNPAEQNVAPEDDGEEDDGPEEANQ